MGTEKTLEFDVSTVANDTYYFYVELGKKCRADLEQAETAMKTVLSEITQHEGAISELKKKKESLTSQIELLKTKHLDVSNLIGELEKNKRQFKAIVTGSSGK